MAIASYRFDGDKPYVFISYSHANDEIVVPDLERLVKRGVNLWYDVNMGGGDNWVGRAIPKIIHENCMAVLFYASYASLRSEPCFDELKYAKEAFAKFLDSKLNREMDYDKHARITDTSKKIIPIDIVGGKATKMIDDWLANQSNPTLNYDNIEYIKNYVFQKNQVLYIVHNNDGSHIDKVLNSLNQLPEKVISQPPQPPPPPSLGGIYEVKLRHGLVTGLKQRDLVYAVVLDYLEGHPKKSLAELQQAFPKRVQKQLEIVVDEAAANQLNIKRSQYKIFSDQKLTNSSALAICNQWGKGNIKNFIDHAETLGYEISEV